MAPRRILVTGAAGFVGSHLLPALGKRFPASEIIPTSVSPRAGFKLLDITDPDGVPALINDVRPDACIHLAAIAAIPAARSDPDLAWRVNLHGTLALARALSNAVQECMLLFVSSSDIYGASFRTGRALDEAAVPAPLNTYGATKAAADLALGALAAEGLRVVRVRPFNHTGAGQSTDFVVPAFARQIARIRTGMQEPVIRAGRLDVERDFTDVRDVCAAYADCLDRADAIPPGTILNIASGTSRRIGGVLQELLALARVEASIETEANLLRPADIARAAADASRARAILGWEPRIPWRTTLLDVLADWKTRVS